MFIVYRLKKTHKSEEKATKLNAQLERWFEPNCSAPHKKQINKHIFHSLFLLCFTNIFTFSFFALLRVFSLHFLMATKIKK